MILLLATCVCIILVLSCHHRSYFTSAQVNALKPNQIGAFINDQVAWMNDPWMQTLNADQTGGFTDAQIQNFHFGKFASMPAANYAKFKVSAIPAGPHIFNVIPPAAIPYFALSEIPKLSEAQIKFLTPDHIKQITKAQFDVVTPSQVAMFPATSLAHLQQAIRDGMLPTQIAVLTSTQLRNVNSNTSISKWSITQYRAVNALAFSVLQELVPTVQQLQSLTPQEFKGFILYRFPRELFDHVTTAQWNGLDNWTPLMWLIMYWNPQSGITPAQFAKIPPGIFGSVQGAGGLVQKLTLENMILFTPAQFAAFPPSSIITMNYDVFQRLSPAHINAMTDAQIAAIPSGWMEIKN